MLLALRAAANTSSINAAAWQGGASAEQAWLQHWLVAFAAKADERFAESKAFEVETGRSLKAFKAEFREFKAEIREFETEFREFETEIREFETEFREFETEFREFETEFREFGAEFQGRFLEFSEAVVTSSVHERLDSCAENMTLILIAPFYANTSQDLVCSAVPMFSAGVAADAHTNLLFTSAHCFMSISEPLAPAAPVVTTAKVFYNRAVYRCSLVRHFFSGPDFLNSMDLAIVRCGDNLTVASPALTTLPPRPRQRVAMFGFSPGRHLDPRLVYHDSALHVRVTSLAPSLQLPGPASAGTALARVHGSGAAPTLRPAGSVGYLQASPEGGMSGGAVVDMQCGLLGVNEARSIGTGGSFVLFSAAVVERIRSTAAETAF